MKPFKDASTAGDKFKISAEFEAYCGKAQLTPEQIQECAQNFWLKHLQEVIAGHKAGEDLVSFFKKGKAGIFTTIGRKMYVDPTPLGEAKTITAWAQKYHQDIQKLQKVSEFLDEKLSSNEFSKKTKYNLTNGVHGGFLYPLKYFEAFLKEEGLELAEINKYPRISLFKKLRF